MEVSLPRGVRDYAPKEAAALKQMLAIVENVYKKFGFYPIETPHLETLDTLSAKAYGSDTTKEIYSLSDEKSGLRFDLTVPLARFLAMNKNMPLPFKRYCIGSVWRKDEPQKMRNREFMQADIDVVGSAEPVSDSEVLAAAAVAIDELGFNEYTILINNRVILEEALATQGFAKDNIMPAVRIIDKLAKSTLEQTAKDLAQLGVAENKCTALLEMLGEEGRNEEKLEKAEARFPKAKAEVQRLRDVLALLSKYKFNGAVKVDFTLARGLDYYTSLVWEFTIKKDGKRLPTICAGGRYDGLIGLYSKNPLPATGVSIGISRLFEAMEGDFVEFIQYDKTYVAYLKKDDMEYALGVANALRASGLYVDLNSTERNLAKQLTYANALSFAHVIIIGKQERDQNLVKLREMSSGNEELLTVNDAIKKIKGD